MTTRTCCFIGCGKPAEWELLGSNAAYESVDSCTAHVGELLDDSPETRVTFIGQTAAAPAAA